MCLEAGVEPDVITMNTVLHAAAGAGDSLLIDNVLRQMKLLKLSPDIITCNTILYGYGVANDAAQVWRVVEEFMPKEGITPNATTVSTVAESLVACYRNEPSEEARAALWQASHFSHAARCL
jgi:pentatricopeptide repeat protein